MRNFLKRYRVKLVTIGPVHIGSGKLLRKDMWLSNGDSAIIIDPGKLFDLLSRKNLIEAYEKYISQPKREPFYRWLQEKGIRREEQRAIGAYELEMNGVELTKARDVHICMKDAYGNPYIPGSSLKGALRNILLAKRINENGYNSRELEGDIRAFCKDSRKYLSSHSRNIQQESFKMGVEGREEDFSVDDMMRNIRISDSKALEIKDLTLCQKIDIKIKDSQESELPILRESIRPGVIIEFDMTIDTSEPHTLDIKYIKEAIAEFLQDYNDMFLEHFEKETLYRDDVIYLGGGVGFHSKTALNQVLKGNPKRVELVAETIDNPKGKNRSHGKDKLLGVSPRVAKLTEYDGELLQMGPCSIEFEEL